ncbi:MAG TPA: undecaprenyl-phosphate glucose phosphotransferase [Geminicoccaceae bacterium]|nr:undecaprenyl-phosphate glucose phosphotransferase [Geminicoccaceae bacterium]
MSVSSPPSPTDTRIASVRQARARLTPGVVGLALRAVDLVLIALTAIAALELSADAQESSSLFWFAIACAALIALDLFAAADIYRPRDLGSVRAQAIRVAAAWSAVQALLVLLAVATRSTAELPLGFFWWWWVGALAALVVLHGAVAVAVGRGQRAGWLATRVALVGAGPQADHFIGHVRRHDPGVVVLGIFDERRSRVPDRVAGCRVLGTLDDLIAFARAEPIDQIIVTLPQHAANRRLAGFEKLRDLPVDVRLSPDLPGMELAGRGVAELAGMPLLRVFDRPLTGWGSLAKAVEDRLLAALVLALGAPLMLVVAVLVRAGSPGPALYRQRRYGFDNRPIEVLKFRTMYVERCDGADTGEVVMARRQDPRVTPIGRLLRRTSLDELPQFLNVLKGEMSIVGPRPHAVAHNERYAGLIDGYLARHRVKPGITGWAQVNGLRGEAETLARMQERVRYDLHYIENWSLLLDLRIILCTLLVGFSHPNAY